MAKDTKAALVYIRTIRNTAKRDYAERFWRYLNGSADQPDRGGLSFMAAQAVRMRFAELGFGV